MSTVSELFAPNYVDVRNGSELTADDCVRLSAELGTDSLRYLTLSQLVEAMSLRQGELCLGCLTGKYPTPWGNRLYERALKLKDQNQTGRTYEQDAADLESVSAATGTASQTSTTE